MKTLAYLSSLTLLAASVVFAQSSGAGAQSDTSNSSGSSSAHTSQPTKPKMAQPAAGSQDTDQQGTASSAATSSTTQTELPNTAIHDRPATSTPAATDQGQATRPQSGTMGTTGNTPNTSTPPSSSPDHKPNSSDPNNSAPPHTSLNAPPKNIGRGVSATEAMADMPERPAHAPDSGTQPMVQETVFGDPESPAPQNTSPAGQDAEHDEINGLPQTSSLLPLLGMAGMGSLVSGLFLRGQR